ncbi:MAG: hypothetical protein O7J95_00880 [Planctomycetota bacterium]|nr:hypothetical protein [Planctomycetota bacterium]
MGRREESGEPRKDRPLPRDVGDLWPILQEIACEEDPRFTGLSVMEHVQKGGVEARKDVSRWLEIYRVRVEPGYEYRLPSHHPRYRGVCLIHRNWPTGPRWEAFDEESLRRLPVAQAMEREALERAIDDYLARESSGD